MRASIYGVWIRIALRSDTMAGIMARRGALQQHPKLLLSGI
jgi:hypothetical protein